MSVRLFYSGGRGSNRPLSELPPPASAIHKTAGQYHASAELVAAVNVALILGQPLLLTGEAGTGKTGLAFALAESFGQKELLECLVKSTTTAKELFYTFDELARFRDAQDKDRSSKPLQSYLVMNGLGKAILFAGGPEAALKLLPGAAFETDEFTRPTKFKDLFPAAEFPVAGACHSVVLIDELDKAPRDTPNDMLNEIDRMGFDIPELGVRVELPRGSAVRPIVVITSNSEKSLPDPFLRRCVYHDIAFPDDAELRKIVYARVTGLKGDGQLLTEALELFAALRDRGRGIRKPPGTAELLAWLEALRLAHDLGAADSLRARLRAEPGSDRRLYEHTLSVLIKSRDDRTIAKELIDAWAGAAPVAAP